MKPLYHAFALSTAFLAGSSAFAGSVGPGGPQGGQTVALGNLNAAILSSSTNGFYYAGANSSSPIFVGGGAPSPFSGGFIPSGPSQPSVPSLFTSPSDPSFVNNGNGGSTPTTNSSSSNSSSSNGGSSGSNSSSNSSGSNPAGGSTAGGSNSGGNNSSSNNSGGGTSGGESSGSTTPGVISRLLESSGPGSGNALVASVPDNGSAIALLGAALAGVALLRRNRRV